MSRYGSVTLLPDSVLIQTDKMEYSNHIKFTPLDDDSGIGQVLNNKLEPYPKDDYLYKIEPDGTLYWVFTKQKEDDPHASWTKWLPQEDADEIVKAIWSWAMENSIADE